MLVGCILGGGAATRLDGTDKLGLVVGGKSICRRLEVALSPLVDEIVVAVGSAARGRPASVPAYLRVVYDEIAGRGPMAGLQAAFSQTNADAILLVGGDMPFVTTPVLELLVRAGTPHYDAAAFRLGGRAEPLLALYRRTLVPHIETLQLANSWRMSDILEKSMGKVRWLLETDLASVDEDFRSIVNLNTAQDLANIRTS